ncbi:flagellar protein FlaG [Thiomicrorhabdus sp.]|uniref:flagellar protein FlaG n=1 Tax=Thiomicrorhabdus sp. TaxID=2039724 RepID=UPI00356952C7
MEINSMSTPAADSTKSLQTAPVSTVSEVAKQQQSEKSVISPAQKTKQETAVALNEQVQKLNDQLLKLGQGLAFAVDENTQSSVVKVIDRTTDEVLKQFPTEGSLRIMKNIQNYLESVQQSGGQPKEGLTGVLFNEII